MPERGDGFSGSVQREMTGPLLMRERPKVCDSFEGEVESTKPEKAAASGRVILVDGDAELEFVGGSVKWSGKFLDAALKRPLAAVCAIVDEGNSVVFGSTESKIEHVTTG